MDVFLNEEAVYGLSVDPINDNVFASACDDGKVVLYDIRASPAEGSFITMIEGLFSFGSKNNLII